MAKQPNGYIIYEGPSQLDGQPIVVIATGFAKSSGNVKTGAMIQTWIVRADMAPTDAAHAGADASICGDCPHRGTVENGRNTGRTCYVTLFQAPRSVYAAYQRGVYPHASLGELRRLGAGRFVRLGSYGDPVAAPIFVWSALTREAAGWTGYTHQWRNLGGLRDRWQGLLMASCDSAIDRDEAMLAGWRCFRVMGSVAERDRKREVICPASAEAGFKTTCHDCRACAGTSAKARASIAIVAHGAAGKRLLTAS